MGIGAEVIVTNRQGQVLLGVRKDLEMWASFGGHIDPKESIVDCALRELHEETGLRLPPEALTPIGFLSEYDRVLNVFPNGHEMQSLALVFTAVCEDAAVPVDGEYESFKWFDLSGLPAKMQPFSRNSLELYQTWLATGQFQVM